MLYLIAYLLNAFDAFSTWVWVTHYGIEMELNPVGTWMIENFLMWFFKVVVVGWLILFLYANRDKTVSVVGAWIILIVYACICVKHILLFIAIR